MASRLSLAAAGCSTEPTSNPGDSRRLALIRGSVSGARTVLGFRGWPLDAECACWLKDDRSSAAAPDGEQRVGMPPLCNKDVENPRNMSAGCGELLLRAPSWRRGGEMK